MAIPSTAVVTCVRADFTVRARVFGELLAPLEALAASGAREPALLGVVRGVGQQLGAPGETWNWEKLSVLIFILRCFRLELEQKRC